MGKVSCAESNEIDFATCTGSSDPPGDGCYEGKAGALGLTEDVKVSVKSYAGGKGTMDLSGSGIESFTCKDHSFTKSGQEISMDVSDCVPHAIAVSDVKYCSDSDQIKVTVKDKTVPLPISAMLSKTTCAKSLDSELASESPTQELPSIASSPVDEDFVQGGTLKLGWKDCGDSSYHAKVTSLTPSTLTIGANTHVVGQGNVDEEVTAGSFSISSKAIIGPAEHFSGNVCQPKTFNLPMGLATITWDGLKCPVAKGQADVGVNVKLAASIPAKLARTTIDLKATSSSGHNLICMGITTAPEQAETVAAIASSPDLTDDAMVSENPAQELPPIVGKLVCKLAEMGEPKAIDAICQKVPIPGCQDALQKVFDKLLAKCQPGDEDFVEGGKLQLGWKDCGDSSCHAKVTSLTPSTLTIGANTHVVGQGNVDEP